MEYGELEKKKRGKIRSKEPKKERKMSILFLVTAVSF